MWALKKIGYRGYQVAATGAMYAWGWFFPDPIILQGPGCVKDLPTIIRCKGFKKVLVVTDPVLMSLGILDSLFASLKDAGVEYAIYDQVQPNPTIKNVREAQKVYNDNHCQAIVALGGGSPMDCAKGTAAVVARPNRPLEKMAGTGMVILPALKMGSFLPPSLFAIPTTAGTGSETTIAAVITDEKTHDKFPIMDPFIRAKYAVLDPELTVGLPPHITSTTGMDALTHAVEGYTNILYMIKSLMITAKRL